MARCAGRWIIAGKSSVSCATRSPGWRVAQLNQVVEEDLLE
ncbi:hypothetical protein A2U01_0107517, partial [Trifolium medium]|nr:hypothetical protein [Trifolium medium]